MRAILLLAISVHVLLAQIPNDKGSIEGILSSRTTSQPLRKGTLTLRSVGATASASSSNVTPKIYTTVSDAEGKFAFDQVGTGRYELTAAHAGFLPATYRVRGSAIITIDPNEKLTSLRFEMMPYGVISGRVVDEGGDPITEVRVGAMRHTTSNGRRSFRTVSTPASIDEQGNFRIANLLPGRYILAARVDTMAKGGTTAADYVTTYYSNAVDPSEAALLSVRAGAEVNATIRLRKEPVFHLEGKIVDAASGAPCTDTFLIELRPQSVSPEFASVSSASTEVINGIFRFDKVLQGSYAIEPSSMVVIMNRTDRIEAKVFGRYPVTVTNENLTGLVVPFSPGVTISGSFKDDTEEEAPLIAKPNSKTKVRPTVRLMSENRNGRDFFGPSKNDGAFEVSNVAPSRYLVSVSGLDEGAYVKSMRFGRKDITSDFLDLTAGVSEPLEIVVSSKGADVSGVVHNEKTEKVADVLVTLTPVSAKVNTAPALFRQVRTDQDGQFKIKGLPPGEYRVLAWEEVDVNLTMDPEFRQLFDDDVIATKLKEGSHEDVQVKLVSREAIEKAEAKMR